MKSAEERFEELTEEAWKLITSPPFSTQRDRLKAIIRQAHVDGMQDAVNVARRGKMKDVQNELERGNNLALDSVVENLENRIKKIKEGK